MAGHADGFLKACSLPGLETDVDLQIEMDGDARLRAVARIHNPGGIRGMLVFGRGADYARLEDQLVRDGYCNASFDPPRSAEEFDIERYRIMFCEGAGPARKRGDLNG